MIGLIWAQAANGVIGREGSMPWHIPEDLAHFREVTEGSTVLMGRRTWDSLPARFRPLPGRRNLVLTRDRDWAMPGAEAVHDLSCLDSPDLDLWVMGGAEVYAAAMAHADVLEVSELREPVEGDVHAPIVATEWTLERTRPEDGWFHSTSGLALRWRRYVRAS